MDLSSVTMISADSHVEEPHDLWWDNLPPVCVMRRHE